MKTMLEDGRIFETQPFKFIEFDPSKPVYKYTFETDDRKVQTSAGHEWVVWNKKNKIIEMIPMSEITIENYELLVQSFEK